MLCRGGCKVVTTGYTSTLCTDRECLCWPPAPAGAVQQPSSSGGSGVGSGATQDGRLPFLFDVGGMPDEATACSHCKDDWDDAVQCCGVCVFDHERCDTLYPGQNKSAAVAALLMGNGFQLQVGRLLQDGLNCNPAALWLEAVQAGARLLLSLAMPRGCMHCTVANHACTVEPR